MATDAAGSLAVDVLVIGGGLAGHQLASSLHPRWSVCLVRDPTLGDETLDGDGYVSAGYDGNDVARIQPARRAAAEWRLWAEQSGLLPEEDPRWIGAPDELADRRRLWQDATLPVGPQLDPPAPFDEVEGLDTAVALPADLVLDPGAALAALRAPMADRYLEATVERFRLFTDDAVDAAELEVGGSPVAVAARFVVVVADAGNAVLLSRLASRFKDPQRRTAAKEAAATGQAVRTRTVVAVRGDLPVVSGTVGGLRVVAQRVEGDVVWLVSPPPRDADTVLGQVDLRFPPALHSEVVADVVEALRAVAPLVHEQRHDLRWHAYARRQTEHPMIAVPDSSEVGQPTPARLETLGMDAFLALWPGHPAFAMLVADVAAERIAAALGEPADDLRDGPVPADLSTWPSAPTARWASRDLPWSGWADFARDHDLKADEA